MLEKEKKNAWRRKKEEGRREGKEVEIGRYREEKDQKVEKEKCQEVSSKITCRG